MAAENRDLGNLNAPDTFRVRVDPLGLEFVAQAGESLLLAAKRAGVTLPSSCRNGTCRACLCELRQGQVAYLVEWPGLSAEEKLEGGVLPCVAVARSELTLWAEAARPLVP
ncbi:MAG: hypothetical protein RLZZ618_670 [Pseudomonadota bacterium]|jgi:ferredoxin